MPVELGPAYRLLMTADAVGGVWRYVLDLARGLSPSGVAVTLATLGPAATLEQRREAKSVPGLDLIETGESLDWLCERPNEITRAARAVADIARVRRVDLIQLNGTVLAGQAYFGAPVVAMHHSCLATWWSAVKDGRLTEDWAWRRELTHRHLNAVDSVAAPSRAFAEATAATYDLASVPHVIHNGRPWTQEPAVDPPAFAVLTAGRLWDEGKNVATFERAARHTAAPLYAAGPVRGPNGAQIRLSAAQPLGELGEPQMRACFAERPIFVSTALYEPFGLAVLEAAQAGCALILSNISTFRELWDGAAWFVNPRDAHAVADAANSLLAEPSAREALGAKARERASHFSAQKSADAALAWHRDILARRQMRRSMA